MPWVYLCDCGLLGECPEKSNALARPLEWQLSAPTLQHHCVPGVCKCASPQETRDLVYASLLECRAVLSTVDIPSSSRWMSTSGVAAVIVCFILCHGILPAAYRSAFADWRSGDLPRNEEAEDEFRVPCAVHAFAGSS